MSDEDAFKMLLRDSDNAKSTNEVYPYHGLARVMEKRVRVPLDKLTYKTRTFDDRNAISEHKSSVGRQKVKHSTYYGELNRRIWRFDGYSGLVVVEYRQLEDNCKRSNLARSQTYHAPAEPRATSALQPSMQQPMLPLFAPDQFSQTRNLYQETPLLGPVSPSITFNCYTTVNQLPAHHEQSSLTLQSYLPSSSPLQSAHQIVERKAEKSAFRTKLNNK